MGVSLSGNWSLLDDVSTNLLGRDQMQAIGDFAVRTVKARVGRGVGSDDAPMPPLKTVGVGRKGRPRPIKYSRQKLRAGGQAIRDLRGPGKGPHMLDQMDVLTVTDDSVLIGFTSQDAYKKAAVNEKRTPWIGFANSDVRSIVEYAQGQLDAQVRGGLSNLKRGKL